MRRILLLPAVASLVAAMLVNGGPASASPSIARPEDGTFIDSDSDGDFDLAAQPDAPGIDAVQVPVHVPINVCG